MASYSVQYCIKCYQSELLKGKKFLCCGECGFRLAVSDAQPEKMSAHVKDMQFCFSCGEELQKSGKKRMCLDGCGMVIPLPSEGDGSAKPSVKPASTPPTVSDSVSVTSAEQSPVTDASDPGGGASAGEKDDPELEKTPPESVANDTEEDPASVTSQGKSTPAGEEQSLQTEPVGGGEISDSETKDNKSEPPTTDGVSAIPPGGKTEAAPERDTSSDTKQEGGGLPTDPAEQDTAPSIESTVGWTTPPEPVTNAAGTSARNGKKDHSEKPAPPSETPEESDDAGAPRNNEASNGERSHIENPALPLLTDEQDKETSETEELPRSGEKGDLEEPDPPPETKEREGERGEVGTPARNGEGGHDKKPAPASETKEQTTKRSDFPASLESGSADQPARDSSSGSRVTRGSAARQRGPEFNGDPTGTSSSEALSETTIRTSGRQTNGQLTEGDRKCLHVNEEPSLHLVTDSYS